MKKRHKLHVFGAADLPPMHCEKGCGECCGPVPVTRTKLEEVRAYCAAHSITPMPHGTRCPLYIKSQCAIYEIRPRVCQAYGHSPKLSCSRGHDVHADDQLKLARWVFSEGMPTTTLHELVGLEDVVGESAARTIARRA